MKNEFEVELERESERVFRFYRKGYKSESILAEMLDVDSFSLKCPDDLEMLKKRIRQDFIYQACTSFIECYDQYKSKRRLVCNKGIERETPSWRAGMIRCEKKGLFWAGLEKADDPSFVPSYCRLYTAEEMKLYENEYYYLATHLKNKTKIEKYLATQKSFINAKSYLLKGEKATIRMLKGEVLHPLITEEREFDLAFVRIIAGAMLVYHNPERFRHHAVKTGAIQSVTPDSKIQDLARELTERLADQKIKQPRGLGIALENLSEGRLPRSHDVQYSKELKGQRQAFVREITLLAQKCLLIDNGKKNRFPPAAILSAFGLVEQHENEKMVGPKTIENWQAKHDHSCHVNSFEDENYALGIPLTDHRFSSLYSHQSRKTKNRLSYSQAPHPRKPEK